MAILTLYPVEAEIVVILGGDDMVFNWVAQTAGVLEELEMGELVGLQEGEEEEQSR
jgi:hypothetical protein